MLQLTLGSSDYLQLAGGWLLLLLLLAWAALTRGNRLQGARGQLARRVFIGAGVAAIVLVAGVHLNRGRPGYNTWDLYHTTIGGKFSPELGYEHLYDCSLQLALPKETRDSVSQVRDLATLKVRAPAQGLSEEQCADLFSPQRLREFQHDSRFFLGPGAPLGPQVFLDFGYNGTPFHALLVRAAFGQAEVTSGRLYAASWVDNVLILGALVLIFRGFGFPGLALTTAIIGLNIADASVSMNASFLRHSYLAALLAAVSLLAQRRPLLAGALVAGATADRLFPICFVVAYVTWVAVDTLRKRRPSSDDLRFVGAFVGTLATLILLSSIGAGRASWRECLVHLWRREHALFVSGVGLKPFFIVPSPLRVNVQQLIDIFVKNGSIDCWWGFYPVAAVVVIWAAYLLLQRLPKLPFTLLFGVILLVTLASPLPYYLVVLAMLGPLCALLSAKNQLGAALWTVAALVLALTVQAIGRIGYLFATAFMSPMTFILLTGLVRLCRSEPAQRRQTP